ncbi:hypothetical protein KHA80_00610 [Anaerobacillus sp. HL2]|nr:hypothetical protein KHA80_00610 [Anaerobacillus sp. HL2]
MLALLSKHYAKKVLAVIQKLDFSSRDTLRKAIENLAISARLRMPENLVAMKALELASEFEKGETEGC